MSLRAVVSVHDVRPSTLPRVLSILDFLREKSVWPVTLLVVPGLEWNDRGLETLRRLAREGYDLAGHGWIHRAPEPASLHHRAHAALISRDQAEHLSRGRTELRELVARCHAWFGEVELPEPELYVPPAWALGRLGREELAELPFRWYEVLTGILDARTARLRVTPLVGFEADTGFRQRALRLTNALNLGLARMMSVPVRIAVHPPDLDLRLAGDLRRTLDRDWDYATVEGWMGGWD